ncbi:hypothetical protein O7614_08935 [Micromonospora sp. WMMD961]|uniref:hypothetical protein n=1 Tax=Micromonospora sp. WMMD961 TaxID=3016100 RepID=UPI002416D891|nr:hypothetical protein [Micromonospora sp. WMMD961]MDG4779765.1 hypothetical protein [Micromonospora sp. WMMD961]
MTRASADGPDRPAAAIAGHPDDVPSSARGLWITSAEAVTWNADCAQLRDGWVQEQFWVADVHRDRIPAGDPGTIFDLDAPAPTTTRC